MPISAFLISTKLPTWASRAKHGVGPQARKGSDAAVVPDHGLFDDAVGVDLGVGADARIANQAIRSDLDAGAQVHLADQHGVHVDEHVALHA